MFISTVPQGHCRVIERFGKPISVQRSGLRFKIPLIDKVKKVSDIWGTETNKDDFFIELTEQITDTPPREYFTKDNVKVTSDCVMRWRIVDPVKAIYEVDNLHRSIKETVLNSMRGEIGSRELDNVLSARQSISESILANISPTLSRWGIQLTSVELQELKTDNATAGAMLQQLEAERRSRAIAAQAKGEAEAILARANAEKSESHALDMVKKLEKQLSDAKAAEKSAKEDLKKAKNNPDIPESIMERLRKEAEAKAAEQAAADVQKRLDAAQVKMQAAVKAKAAAEAAAKEAQDKLVAAQKAEKISNPDVMSINVLGKQLLTTWNTIKGHRIKAVAADPANAEPIRKFLQYVITQMTGDMEA